MNAVGIDVSKGRRTVTIRRPGDVIILAPQDYRHTQSSINDILSLALTVFSGIVRYSLFALVR